LKSIRSEIGSRKELRFQMRAIPTLRGVVVATVSFVALAAWVPGTGRAAPATNLLLTNDNCAIQNCPHPIPTPTLDVRAGDNFAIYVAALNAANSRDILYTGTVRFLSSDPTATLPQPYTFVPADEGGRAFTAILRRTGPQTITVVDANGILAPGTLVMTVTGVSSPSVEVPTLVPRLQLLLALLLGGAGLWLSRSVVQ
jgi:hypothetical protein